MPFDWSAHKQKARDAVHNAFKWEALYNDQSETDLPVNVRFHNKSAYLGNDLDSFSPGYFADIDRVIVDSREVTPTKGGTFTFSDPDNSVVTIDSFKRQGEYYILCEVHL